MKETIVYIRTSTEEQTPELQLKDCEALVKKLNLNEYEVISDKQSAWKDNAEREGFDKITEAIKRRELKTLITWDFDRLYRNRKRLVAFFELCKIYSCKIYSARQDWFESLDKMPKPWDEIIQNNMLQIMGWMAEDESSKKSMRVKNAIRIEQGITKSYKGKKWGRKRLSQSVINQVIMLHNQGHSLRDITDDVFYYDKNRNKKKVSLGVVHKIIKENNS